MLEPSVLSAHLNGLDSIDESVDSGGQKSVYRCSAGGSQYALKVIKLPATSSEEDQADREAVQHRAQREIDIMKKIDNPFLVGPGPIALESITVDDEDYLCFSEEWIDGRDIASRIEHGDLLTEDECWDMALQISSAIGDLWEHRLLHRDVSARNVMIRSDGRFVLIDLGYAFDFLSPSLTKHHGTPGTMQYMAPERFNLARKRYIDHRADQFSLGVVLYAGISSFHPYYTDGMGADDYIDHLCNGSAPPPKPSKLVKTIGANLDSLVLRLIARQPHLRFRSCAAARRAVDAHRAEATL